MPYLLQDTSNRVENIKKKFENARSDGRGGNDSFSNFKCRTAPSKATTKCGSFDSWELHGNSESECDGNNKRGAQGETRSGKTEVNKCDAKAIVRRSPAFRRDKLNYGKSVTNLCDARDGSSHERKKFQIATGPEIKHIITEPVKNSVKQRNDLTSVKLSNNFRDASNDSNKFKLSQSKPNNCDSVNNSFTPRNSDATKQEPSNSIKSDNNNDRAAVQCTGDRKTVGKSVNDEPKCELKLSDSIRLALKSPLPKGPPPKKPPRTFLHTLKDTATDMSKDSSSPVAATGALVKDDPMLKLKLEKIEKVVKSLNSRNQTVMPWEGNRTESSKSVFTMYDMENSSNLGHYGKPDCFKGLNCVSADGCEKSVTNNRELLRQSFFYIDNPHSESLFNSVDMKSSQSCGRAVPDAATRTGNPEPIYDLPFIAKKNSFESFGKVAKEKENGRTSKTPQLHYMCTDVVNSLKEECAKASSKFLSANGSDLIGDTAEVDKRRNCFGHPVKRGTEDGTSRSDALAMERRTASSGDDIRTVGGDFVAASKSKSGRKGARSSNPSDSDSSSSGIEDPLESGRSRCSGRRIREDCSGVSSQAWRKTYVKRVSSKLMNQACLAKRPSNDGFAHLFESCILVGLTLTDAKVTVPYIKSIFPAVIQPPPQIESLCFPDASTWSLSSNHHQQGEQYYTLVITNENGDRKFGYCRRVLPEGGTLCLPLVYCIISPHRANGFYYKVLQELESRHGSSEIQDFIRQLYECSFPGPGQSLKFKKILEEVTKASSPTSKEDAALPSTIVRRPRDVRLEENDLSQLVQHLKVSILLKVFSSLLLERKVLLVGLSLRNLSSCIEALQSLLIPFSWQHTFIPVLPSHLNEMCDVPTPYVIGLQKSSITAEWLSNLNFEEGIMVDLEESLVMRCCGDEGSILPRRLVKELKTALDLAVSASIQSDNDRNLLISEAFIRFFVEVCGNYSFFMSRQSDGKKIFQKEEFVSAAVPAVQPFLDWFVETAMFRSFIQERLVNDSEDLFKRRAMEHRHETEKNTALVPKNYKGVNKKVMKTLGDKIKDLTLFNK